MKGDTRCHHELEDLILIRCQFCPKKSRDSMQALTKSQQHYFSEIENSILKFLQNLKGSQITKRVLKKNKAGRLTSPDFKTYYTAIIIKTAGIKTNIQVNRFE